MRRSALPALAAALILAACRAAPGPTTPRADAGSLFRLSAAASETSSVVPAGTSPAAPGGSVASAIGRLTVTFGPLLAKARQGAARRRLAQAADPVDQVALRAAGGDMVQEASVSREALATGVERYTFEGLPAGPVAVQIDVLDAAGAVLASEWRAGSVIAGGEAIADAADLGGPPAPAPASRRGVSGGGSSSAAPAAGSVALAIDVADGAAVTTPVIRSRRFAGQLLDDVTAVLPTRDGAVWCGLGRSPAFLGLDEYGYQPPREDGPLWRIAPDGGATIVAHERYDFMQIPIEHWRLFELPDTAEIVTIGSAGGLNWQGQRFGAAGGSLGWVAGFSRTMPAAGAGADMLMGNFDAGGVQRLAPGMNLPTTVIPLPETEYVLHVVPGADGGIWIAGDTSEPWEQGGALLATWIRRYDPTGALQASIALPAGSRIDMVGDNANGAWYLAPDGRSLVHLAANATIVSTTALPRLVNQLHRAPSGDVWAYAGNSKAARTAPAPPHRGGADDQIVRIAPDGAIKARYHVGVGADITELAVSADGATLWVGTGLVGLLEVAIAR